MLCISPQTSRSVNCCQLYRLVHPLSTTVHGHVHSPYSGIQSKKSDSIFFEKCFIMAYQLYQRIYSLSIVESTCHWVFSYEVVNVIIFQCIGLFFTFLVPMQVRYRSDQWIPIVLFTCKRDKKCWRAQLSDHWKNNFLFLLEIVRRDVNAFEIYVSNIRFQDFF
jgi:hypothetical protein